MSRMRRGFTGLLLILLMTSFTAEGTRTNSNRVGLDYFKVFASTYNAGDAHYDQTTMSNWVTEVLGNEMPDIVFLGFQEFIDRQGELVNHPHFNGWTSHTQYWDSGPECSGRKPPRADTVLYAFVKSSKWIVEESRVEDVVGVSYTNPSLFGTRLGRNFRLGEDKECGKAVNVMKFHIKSKNSETSFTLCGLNTHMRVKTTAGKKMTDDIQKAMAVAEQCDVTFFMGDFNSRLHCLSDDEADDEVNDEAVAGAIRLPTLAPMARVNARTEIFTTFCSDRQSCKMEDSKKEWKWDELNQILGSDSVTCSEKIGDTWNKTERTKNSVKNYNYNEVAVPDWAPTYKLGKRSNIQLGSWTNCDDDGPDALCFFNSKNSTDNWPSWTDRILMKFKDTHSLSLSLSTNSYRRVSSAIGLSDHVPVTASVTIQPGQASQSASCALQAADGSP